MIMQNAFRKAHTVMHHRHPTPSSPYVSDFKLALHAFLST